jgi:hypothetical protein
VAGRSSELSFVVVGLERLEGVTDLCEPIAKKPAHPGIAGVVGTEHGDEVAEVLERRA